MQKCLKIGCDNEVTNGFQCCSWQHGADVKMFRHEIDLLLDADDVRSKNPKYTNNRSMYTVEEAIAYA